MPKTSQTVLSPLNPKKTRAIEEATGRRISAAVAVSDNVIEFVTLEHEHFLFDRKRQTFSRVPDDDVQHREPLCR